MKPMEIWTPLILSVNQPSKLSPDKLCRYFNCKSPKYRGLMVCANSVDTGAVGSGFTDYTVFGYVTVL